MILKEAETVVTKASGRKPKEALRITPTLKIDLKNPKNVSIASSKPRLSGNKIGALSSGVGRAGLLG